MKKYFIITFFLFFSIAVLDGCKKQSLPIPEYPIDETTINDAFNQANLPWTIEEELLTQEGQSAYTFNKDGKMIASLNSGTKDGESLIALAIVQPGNYEYNLPEAEWENVINFMTIIFGGFDNTHQVYKQFSEDYDTKNTTKEFMDRTNGGSSGFEQRAVWQSEVNGVDCEIVILRPYLSIQKEYMSSLIFFSNRETFWGGSEPLPCQIINYSRICCENIELKNDKAS